MVKNIYSKDTPHEKIEHYDVVILGAGPAGLTAALYAGRYNMKVAVIAKSFGGTANLAGEIENWPGFMGPGLELMSSFKNQAEKFGAKFLEAEVNSVEKDENGFVLSIDHKVVHGKTLILALGTEHRKLNILGEKEFLGKGVSYCATCDGMFFKNKTVAVVGGADSAAKAALYLSELAKKVYIIYRKDEIRCEPIALKQIENTKNIEIKYYSIPVSITGNKKVEKIEIEQKEPAPNGVRPDGQTAKAKKITLDVDGVFIEIGATPVKEIINKLGIVMDAEGYLITDKKASTSVPGVFAAGDITNIALRQVVTAAGEGAIAAKSAYDFLKYKK